MHITLIVYRGFRVVSNGKYLYLFFNTVSWYLIHLRAAFFPKPMYLIGGGILAGIIASPLWVAQGTYLTLEAASYAAKTGMGRQPALGCGKLDTGLHKIE